ncbi:MAG: helix-turn-helix domain-containing protein [Phycisphaerales bacterium]
MNNATQSQATERLAIPASEVAKLLSISERHVWALNSSGRIPRPSRLGRAVRWNVNELRAWQDAGCPARDAWERIKNGKGAGSDDGS